jgi:hypothetical protein
LIQLDDERAVVFWTACADFSAFFNIRAQNGWCELVTNEVFDLVVKVYGAGYQIMTIVLHDGFLGFVRFQIPERKKLSQRSHGP